MSLINRTFLAWCAEPSRSDATYIYAYPLYEVRNDSYVPVDESIPESVLIHLRDGGTALYGSDFMDNGHVFKIRFNEEPGWSDRGPYSTFNKNYHSRRSYTWISDPVGLVQLLEVAVPIEQIKASLAVPFQYGQKGKECDSVMIFSNGEYFGPFDVDGCSDDHYFIQPQENYRVGCFSFKQIQPSAILGFGKKHGIPLRFIPERAIPSLSSATRILDWMPEEILVDEFLTTVGNQNLSGEMARNLKIQLQGILSAQGAPFLTPERAQRLRVALDGVEERQEAVSRFVDSVLSNDETAGKLMDIYERDHREALEELAKGKINYDGQIQKLEEDLERRQKDNQELVELLETETQEKRARLDEEIRNLEEAKKSKEEECKQAEEELSRLQKSKDDARKEVEREHAVATEEKKRRIAELERRIVEKETELVAKRKEFDAGQELGSLIKKKEEVDERLQKAERDLEATMAERAREEMALDEKKAGLSRLKQEVVALSNELRNEAIPAATEKIRALIDDEIWSGLRFDHEEKSANVPSFDASRLSEKMAPEDIIGRVHEFLSKAGRKVSRNDVVNYLICLTQGFVTTFAGDPGAGKTSLCNLLAKALGLAGGRDTGFAEKRFTEISVERGWTSHKDFIGYFNPLSKQIERSNEEVFSAFSLLSREACEGMSRAPYFFLLDEANLSPIEHYWAAFLRLCDIDSTESRTFNLGGEQSYHVPETVRFLATVNFDHTTEPLSPRFLNRSWIIMLNPVDIDSKALLATKVANAENTVPYESLHAAFRGPNPGEADAILKTVVSAKWKDILHCFEEANCGLVMPRSRKMVLDYLFAASKLMDDSSEGKLVALDYAVSQKILPLVGGSGPRVETLVKSLNATCSSMPRCKRILDSMIARQENGFFQFFSH